MSTIETWKKLQNKSYFDNHRLYKKLEIEVPRNVNIRDIAGKKVVEIGGGYGRNTVFFGKHAKTVYMIEVSKSIIDKAHNFTKSHNLHNIKFLDTNTYDTIIPYGIDYVYEYLVFQHIEPELTQKYIDVLYDRLKVGGKFNMQFRTGNKQAYYPKNLEPTVYHKYNHVISYFDKFKIETVERKRSGNAHHVYIVAKKLK